jgi:subtilisin family serine protease
MLVTRALVVLLVSAAVAPASGLPATPADVHPSRIIVRYRTDAAAERDASPSQARLARRFRVTGKRPLFAGDAGAAPAGTAARLEKVRKRFQARAARAPRDVVAPEMSRVAMLELDTGVDPDEAAREYARDPDVQWAEPDRVMRASFVPDDPYFSSSGSVGPFPDLWGLHATDAATAWDTARGDGIVVAVIDTGVKWSHPDLKNNVWTNPLETRNGSDDDGNGFVDDVYGWDFTIDRARPKDRHGHGTHVAGTIAATGDNGTGVVGMAFRARIMAVRGLDSRGSGYASDLARAILYAAENGADVLNNSWGGGGSQVIRDATEAAVSLGAVVVFAAGNDNSPFLGTAADRNVIAVAATQYGDERAGFSNFGQNVSVAAPGVSVLSLRGPGRVGGTTVGGKYRVLSGTSMATPHTAGVAALLLSEMPGLTVDEVRWHLELNADQPGYPGWEGQRWNPYLGFGRVNAARVFDDPPVTTRIRTAPFELHGLAGTVVPQAATIDFSFTTHDPVAWTASGPAWLVPAPASGTGDGTLSLTLDGSGLSPATLTGPVGITAPAASDGGASIGVTAHLHQDQRTGSEIVVDTDYNPNGPGPAAVASDGQGVLAAWADLPPTGGWRLRGAYVSDAGVVTGPFLINAGGCVQATCYDKNAEEIAIAFDGTNFLVVWNESFDERIPGPLLPVYNRHEYVKAVRVTSAGQVLGTPVVLFDNVEHEQNGGFYQLLKDVEVGFDGTAYTVLWGRLNFDTTYEDATHFWIRRVGTDGQTIGAASHVYPEADTLAQSTDFHLACVTGSCLLAWHHADGERDADGLFIGKVVGRRYTGTTPLDSPPFRIGNDFDLVTALGSDGVGSYLVAGTRLIFCPGPRLCGFDAVGARVTAAGAALDLDGLRLNRSAAEGYPYWIWPGAIAHDGTSFIVTWSALGATTEDAGRCWAFAARVAPDGGLLDTEPEGALLLHGPITDCGDLPIARAATRSYVVWPEPAAADPTRILAQGVFP